MLFRQKNRWPGSWDIQMEQQARAKRLIEESKSIG
jgi:hypothetical protein